jgi:hypothetical protein
MSVASRAILAVPAMRSIMLVSRPGTFLHDRAWGPSDGYRGPWKLPHLCHLWALSLKPSYVPPWKAFTGKALNVRVINQFYSNFKQWRKIFRLWPIGGGVLIETESCRLTCTGKWLDGTIQLKWRTKI